jgi:hypothetical protein
VDTSDVKTAKKKRKAQVEGKQPVPRATEAPRIIEDAVSAPPMVSVPGLTNPSSSSSAKANIDHLQPAEPQSISKTSDSDEAATAKQGVASASPGRGMDQPSMSALASSGTALKLVCLPKPPPPSKVQKTIPASPLLHSQHSRLPRLRSKHWS